MKGGVSAEVSTTLAVDDKQKRRGPARDSFRREAIMRSSTRATTRVLLAMEQHP
jgi:hypothetical protein